MNFKQNQFIELNTSHDFYQNQKIAGSCVKACLSRSEELAKPGVSLREIESECLHIINLYACKPTFLGYKGFPGAICASVNKQLVHGIPSDYILQSGDLLKIDLGATYNGAIADAARTFIVDKAISIEHVELVNKCRQALDVAKASIQVGKRIGSIGYAIDRFIKKSCRFSLITDYSGHGISLNEPHAQPAVLNRSKSDEGVRIQPGLTIAIEPMLSLNSNYTKVASDGWTVLSDGISSHFEDTIYIKNDGSIEVLT